MEFPAGAPLALPEPDRGAPLDVKTATRPSPAGLRLLLAEDNQVNQRLAVAVLTRMGYTVDVVDNGVKALAAAMTGQYAMVLMDCQMPEMDGYEATRAIRMAEAGSGRHLPIAAMTANAMEGDREKCLEAGMDDYVSKPISLERLQEVLDAWLEHPGQG